MLSIKMVAAFCGVLCGAGFLGGLTLSASGPDAEEQRIIDALNEGLRARRMVCWGAEQFSNVGRYEAGQDEHLLLVRENVEGFTGQLLAKRSNVMQWLEILVDGHAFSEQSRKDTRRAGRGMEVETYHLIPKKREYWRPGKGFCVGIPAVTRLESQTSPSPNSKGVMTIGVAFEWEYTEQPEWALLSRVQEEFGGLYKANGWLTVHNKGYTVADIKP